MNSISVIIVIASLTVLWVENSLADLNRVVTYAAGSFPRGVGIGDFDKDGDVDGSDLAVFAAGGGGSLTPEDFAADFGRTDCLDQVIGHEE